MGKLVKKVGEQGAERAGFLPNTGSEVAAVTGHHVVSAGAGRLTASRDTLEAQVRHFWTFIGVNMQEPRTRWGARYADVLSRTSAVVTTTYAIEHRTPQGAPHLLGGAWTALFQKRGDRWVIVQEHLSDTPMGAMTP